MIGDINALVNDPTTVGLLTELGGGAGTDPVARRQAVVTILLALLPSIEVAPAAADSVDANGTKHPGALSAIENVRVLVNVLLNLYAANSTYSANFQNEVRAVFSDLGCADPNNTGTCSVPDDPIMGSGLLGPDAGIYPDITTPSQSSGLLWVFSAASTRPETWSGALYDLITLSSANTNGINLGTLLGARAARMCSQLDPTGQVNRTLQFIVESIDSEP